MKPAILEIQTHAGEKPHLHVISTEETLLGRSVHSDVKLTDAGSSREHAMITWDGDNYVLEDLQSTNGTRVNDKRVRSVELHSNDRIQIGRTTLVFRLEG